MPGADRRIDASSGAETDPEARPNRVTGRAPSEPFATCSSGRCLLPRPIGMRSGRRRAGCGRGDLRKVVLARTVEVEAAVDSILASWLTAAGGRSDAYTFAMPTEHA